jgi:hypothetical protein
MLKPLRKCKSGWRRELGTSKHDQGIITPKAPQNRGLRHMMSSSVYVSSRPKSLFGLEL